MSAARQNIVDVQVRRYQSDDFDAVWALHNEALLAVGAHGGNGPWDDDLRDIAGVYLSAGGEFLIARQDGRLAAIGALRRVDEHACELKRMRVAPALWRQGLGAMMLNLLEARAIELGYRAVVLDTTSVQHAARTLYERAGYRLTGRMSTPSGHQLLLYRKELPGS